MITAATTTKTCRSKQTRKRDFRLLIRLIVRILFSGGQSNKAQKNVLAL